MMILRFVDTSMDVKACNHIPHEENLSKTTIYTKKVIHKSADRLYIQISHRQHTTSKAAGPYHDAVPYHDSAYTMSTSV